MLAIEPHKLLIGIAAHDSRAEMAHNLADNTQAQVFNMDYTRASSRDEALTACAANHLEVMHHLRRLAVNRPWCIVLEDDALPIDYFRTHAAAALQYARSPIVGFYINRAGAALNPGPLREARAAGTAWAVSNHLISAVAYAIQTDYLPDIIARYMRESPESTVEWRVTAWARERRSEVFGDPRFYYTIPSLVDHAPGDSIIFKSANSRVRRAWNLGVAHDWDTPAVEYDPKGEY